MRPKTRIHDVHLRLTDGEHIILLAAAKRSGLTLAQYIRTMALNAQSWPRYVNTAPTSGYIRTPEVKHADTSAE